MIIPMQFIIGKLIKYLNGDNIVYMEKGIVVNESFRVVMPDGTEKSKDESVFPFQTTSMKNLKMKRNDLLNYQHHLLLN